MATLGMQANVQRGYFSSCHPSRDLNSNASYSTRASNDVDNLLKNGTSYGSSSAPMHPEQHLAVKEMLRSTIIQHDAIVRHQIHELHRLYKRQIELTDEMKQSKSNRHHLQLETLWSHPFFAQNSSKFSQTCQASHVAWLNPSFSQSSISGGGTKSSPLILDEGKAIRAGNDPAQAEGRMKNPGLLEWNGKKVGKRILDLELPGAEYIDVEEDSFAVDSYLPVSQMESNPSKRDSGDLLKSDNMAHSISGALQVLVDLNVIPNLDDETDPSDNLLDLVPGKVEIVHQHMHENTHSESQVHLEGVTRTTLTKGDSQACSNVLFPKSESQIMESSSKEENGQSSCDLNSYPEDLSVETLPTTSEDDKIGEAHDLLRTGLMDQSSGKSESKIKNLPAKNTESGLPDNSYLVQAEAANSAHSSSQLVRVPAEVNSKKTLVPSLGKHTSTVVQALPCFRSGIQPNKRSRTSHEIIGYRSSKSPNLECDIKSKSSGFQTDFCSDNSESASKQDCARELVNRSGAVKSTIRIDLNAMSPGSCSSDVAAESNLIRGSEKKLEDGSGSTSLLVFHSRTASRKHMEQTHVESPQVNSASSCYVQSKSGEESDEPDNLHVRNRHHRITPGFNILIDLNAGANEDECAPPFSTEINLEVAMGPQNRSCPLSRGESKETQVDKSSESVEELGNQQEELVRFAADSLVSISSCQIQFDVLIEIPKLSKAEHDDSLHWFAGIASSVVDDPESIFDTVVSCEDLDNVDSYRSDRIDYFEAMTLSLEEMKTEMHYIKTSIQQEEATNSGELPSQPRRGRVRRGRQPRKDFQTEILPSLATLSRYEVTEDLLAIGGLNETSRTRKNSICRKAGRNVRTSSRRRKPAVSPCNVERTTCTTEKKHKTQMEVDIEQRNPICWGKVATRPRGQRRAASYPWVTSILSQG